MYHRKPAVAGSFYPSNPDRLRGDIADYLDAAEKKPLAGAPIALVCPHAGYIYSGPVAAFSYKQLIDSNIEVAIVLAPSHRGRFISASIIPSGIFETPLGPVPIDAGLGEQLLRQSHFEFIKEAHEQEHSLEVQVPFLQAVLPNASLVPIIIGTTDINACRAIAKELAAVLREERRPYIIILSTDLSHFHAYADAIRIDRVFIDKLSTMDEQELYRSLQAGESQACGEGPVLVGLMAAKQLGACHAEILQYANSGDTAGGKDQVVGYLAAAITGR